MNRVLCLAALLVLPVLGGCVGSSDDGDGLAGDAETNGWTIRVETADGEVLEYHVTSDPGSSDTDGDGLDDFQEFLKGSDPRKIDTDGDRLLDGPAQCPEAGTPLADAVLAGEILEHPEQPGCFLGEARWEYQGRRVETDPADANSDSGGGIDDGLLDGEEIEGWDVTTGGTTYRVWSNPSITSADTDGDGLHDGAERAIATDPNKVDTDGDGTEDAIDAAPLGNLVVVVRIEQVTLKQDKRLTGGATLRVDAEVLQASARSPTRELDRGPNRLDILVQLDPSDVATGITAEAGGAGAWTQEVRILFWHDGSSDEPLRVSPRDPAHMLVLQYDAFAGSWTGGASGGTSGGPDADVRIDIETRIL